MLFSFFFSKQDEIVVDLETRRVQEKSEGDITAVQSLLAMSQWSPPSPELSVSPTSDPPSCSSMDMNNQVSVEKVMKCLLGCKLVPLIYISPTSSLIQR